MPAFKHMPCSLFKLQLFTQTKTTKHPQISAENSWDKKALAEHCCHSSEGKIRGREITLRMKQLL
jgi:hypothetical protein